MGVWRSLVHDIAGLRELTKEEKVNAGLLFQDDGPLEVVIVLHDGRYTAKIIRRDMTKVLMTAENADSDVQALQNLHNYTAEELHGRIEWWVGQAKQDEERLVEEARRAREMQSEEARRVQGKEVEEARKVREAEEARMAQAKEDEAARERAAAKAAHLAREKREQAKQDGENEQRVDGGAAASSGNDFLYEDMEAQIKAHGWDDGWSD